MPVNYQFNTQLNVAKAKPTLVAITPHHSVEVISKQHVLLSHTDNQHSLVLANYLVNVIDVLKTYRTVAAHVAEVKAFMQLDHSATQDIQNVIKQLQQNGFIVTADEALAQAQRGDNYQPLQTPPVVVVRTAGRVSMLKRFLQSAADNEYRYNARYEYLVVDDSTAEQAEANALNIAASGLNCRHVDKTQQHALLTEFYAQFPAEKAHIDFLLGEHPLHALSPTYGRTWNWGILLAAGKPTVFLDDDCILETFAPPITAEETLSVGSQGQEAVFLNKDKPLNEQLQTIDLDPIAQLAQVLGTTLKQLPCDASSFDSADYTLGEKLGKSHVMISSPAVAGDPGSASSMWLYFTRGETAKRFWGNSEADYQHHKTQRYLWVGNKRPQLALSGHYSVVARAFDNRQLLPPTLPIFRNEDALFTNLVQYVYPFAAALNMTWALAHQPEIERKWQDSDNQHGKDFDITMAMDDFIDTEMPVPQGQPNTPQVQLTALAASLQQAFSADTNALTRWQYRHQQAARAAQTCALHNALEAAGEQAPEYWQKDIETMINDNIQGEQALRFADIDPETVSEAMQAFANALPTWIKLWQAVEQQTP